MRRHQELTVPMSSSNGAYWLRPYVPVEVTAVAALAPNSAFSVELYLRRPCRVPVVTCSAMQTQRDQPTRTQRTSPAWLHEPRGSAAKQVKQTQARSFPSDGWTRSSSTIAVPWRGSQDCVAVGLHVDEDRSIRRVQAHVLQHTKGQPSPRA